MKKLACFCFLCFLNEEQFEKLLAVVTRRRLLLVKSKRQARQLKNGCLLQSLRVLYSNLKKMSSLVCGCSHIRQHFGIEQDTFLDLLTQQA